MRGDCFNECSNWSISPQVNCKTPIRRLQFHRKPRKGASCLPWLLWARSPLSVPTPLKPLPSLMAPPSLPPLPSHPPMGGGSATTNLVGHSRRMQVVAHKTRLSSVFFLVLLCIVISWLAYRRLTKTSHVSATLHQPPPPHLQLQEVSVCDYKTYMATKYRNPMDVLGLDKSSPMSTQAIADWFRQRFHSKQMEGCATEECPHERSE